MDRQNFAGKRKRPKVPESSRKRAIQACESCRRAKEKCHGGHPCDRCTRLKRDCDFDNMNSTSATVLTSYKERSFLDADRISLLQDVVHHCTGLAVFEKSDLASVLRTLRQNPSSSSARTVVDGSSELPEPKEIGQVGKDDPRDLSHSGFAHHVQKQLGDGSSSVDAEVVQSTDQRMAALTSQIHHDSTLRKILATFPPIDIAKFLVDVFFRVAQTNYSYVDEELLNKQLQSFYANGANPKQSDAAWVCILLMVFAIGTQFAHLNSSTRLRNDDATHHESEHARGNDDMVSLRFYASAKALLPDIMIAANVEGVQAFLLMGVYTLSMDAGGMSWIYLGVAMKLAIYNDLHRTSRHIVTEKDFEIRNRIWWATYTLERRISVLHGRPMSITRREVSAELPTVPQNSVRSDTTPNVLAMIWLTCYLEDGRERLLSYKQSSHELENACLDSIMSLRDTAIHYWESLPQTTYCRDLDPTQPFFRFNLHLALTYHLVHIFLGRYFILRSLQNSSSNNRGRHEAASTMNGRSGGRESILADDSLQNSLEIIRLCQLLQDEVGLSASSYTEYTSCCAALLVILAMRIKQGNRKLQQACNQGIALLKSMAVGLYDDNADKLAIEALEMMVCRLDRAADGCNTPQALRQQDSHAYERFQSWASSIGGTLRDVDDSSPLVSNFPDATSTSVRSQLVEDCQSNELLLQSASTTSAAFPTNGDDFDFAAFLADTDEELTPIPGIDQWFRYGFR